MALSAFWNFLIPISLAVDRNCDFNLDLIVGKEYKIYNRDYPKNYKASTNCRWQIKSSEQTQIVLNCKAELPLENHNNPFFNSKNKCEYQDKILVSETGQKNVADGHSYCGNGTFSRVSKKNSMSVALLAKSNSKGGNMFCTAIAIEVESPVPSLNDTEISAFQTCDCGWSGMTRIVGGEETGVNEFPLMAGLVNRVGGQLFCGAAIISNRFLLTAAHCVYNRDYTTIAVLVGDHNISSGGDTPFSAVYFLSAYEYFPSYNPTTQVNDVALLQTSTTMILSLYVGPVCLPFRFTGSTFYGQMVTVLGWGATEFTGPRSDVLLKANLAVISNLECSLSTTGTVTTSSICTYAPAKDSCQADSGGPVLWRDASTNRLHLVGVISNGLGCGSLIPSINSRVTTFLSWIVQRTQENFCIR